MQSARMRFLRSRTIEMQNTVARMLNGLESSRYSLREDHRRWWQYTVEPPTPIPVNVKYVCDATLGSPGTADCEAALYEFVQLGELTLDPMSGPIIKVTGKSLIVGYILERTADCQ